MHQWYLVLADWRLPLGVSLQEDSHSDAEGGDGAMGVQLMSMVSQGDNTAWALTKTISTFHHGLVMLGVLKRHGS